MRAALDIVPTHVGVLSPWNGPPQHGAALGGDLAEWSCDAVGWLAEVVADFAARLGVSSPLLLTVTRAASTA